MTKKKLIALVLCVCIIASMPAPAAAAESPAEKLLKSMTLEQKIGQMLMPAFQTWTGTDGKSVNVTAINDSIAGAIRDCGLGGVILFSGNASGTASTVKLIGDMQNAAMSSDTGIPLLISVDQEGGYVYRLGTGTDTCGSMALGAAGDPSLAEKTASLIGGELRAEGFNVDFAPSMDVNNNPANPVIGVRSFSDDPALVSKMGTAFVKGLQDQNVSAALKHFPGHGDTATDSHSGLPCITKDLSALESCELIPFKAGIDAGADIIMTAHIQYPQIEKTTYKSISTGEEITLPATLSRTIVTDVLRGKLGFDGVVCTDAMNMGAIATHFSPMDSARFAINAGVDILLMPVTIASPAGIENCKAYINGIADMVRGGLIAESTVDSAVLRILGLKAKRGVLDLSVSDTSAANALSVVGSAENHELEWEITEKAITMVKNDGMLPVEVPEGGKAVFFVSYSNEVNSVKYAVSRMKEAGVIPESADCQVLCYQKMTSVSEEFLSAVRSADAVAASVEATGVSSMDPGASGGWQSAFLDDLIAKTHESGKKIAVISIQLPYDLARYQAADALLAAYSCKGMNTIPTEYRGETASYGPNLPVAVTAVFGAFTPSAKLPVNIPKLDKNHKYTGEILYPRGYGITSWDAASAFQDVPENSYYFSAVSWAARLGITSGVSSILFGPGRACTRAQAVTFRWRAMGCPIAEQSSVKFTDVTDDAFYAKAVSWAVAEGITEGTSDTAFSPDKTCNRAQLVTFLWRALGCPEADSTSVFTDVAEGKYYTEAVYWAVAEGITEGATKTLFRPDKTCDRAQAVTFLWRALTDENTK